MLNIFSIPILVGIAAGTLFPYTSLKLLWLNSFLLFALLFTNTLVIDERKTLSRLVEAWRSVALTQLLLFVFFPVVQFAAAIFLIQDEDFRLGLAVSSLAPSALVVPFLAAQRGGDPELGLASIIVSTVACPLLLVPMLGLMGLHDVFVDTRSLILYLLMLTVLPVGAGLAALRAVPRIKPLIRPWLAHLNSLLLAGLMFILVGTAFNRMPWRRFLDSDLLVLTAFYVWMDFGVYFLVRGIAGKFVAPARAESVALSVSARNFAVSAGVMLFFLPRAALPPAIGLVVHAFFFQFLLSRPAHRQKR